MCVCVCVSVFLLLLWWWWLFFCICTSFSLSLSLSPTQKVEMSRRLPQGNHEMWPDIVPVKTRKRKDDAGRNTKPTPPTPDTAANAEESRFGPLTAANLASSVPAGMLATAALGNATQSIEDMERQYIDTWVTPVEPESVPLRKLQVGFDNEPFPFPHQSLADVKKQIDPQHRQVGQNTVE